MDRRNTTIAFAWLVGSALFTKILVPLATIYFARRLGPDAMGVYYVAWNILTIAEIFRDGGLSQTFIAEAGVSEVRRHAYSALALLSAFLPAIALGALGGVLPAVFGIKPEHGWVIYSLVGILLINAFLTMPLAQLQKDGRFKEVGKAEAAASVTSALLALVLIEVGFGLASLFVMLWVRALLTLWMVGRKVPFVTPRWVAEEVRAVFQRSRTVLASVLMFSPFSLIDGMIVAAKLGTVPNGWYGNARNLALKPAELVSFPLGRTLYVAYSKRLEDPAKLAEILSRSIIAASILVLPIYAFLGVFSTEITVILLGEQWLPSAPIFAVFCLHYSIRSVGTLAGNALTASGRAGTQVKTWLLTYVVVGAALAWKWSSLEVMDVAWIFCGGAALVYSLQIGIALRLYRPTQSHVKRFGLVLAMVAAIGVLMLGLRSLPIPMLAQVLLAGFTLPIATLIGCGTVLEGKPSAFLSPKGIRNLRNSL